MPPERRAPPAAREALPPARHGPTGPDAGALSPELHGPALALASVYALFALAAGARSLVQLATRAGDAPIPYALSALAAAIYLAGAVILHRQGPHTSATLRTLCAIELAGVLIVGTLSVLAPSDFPDATVWSQYGAGYGWIPLVLPLLGLALASRQQRSWSSERARIVDAGRSAAP